MFPHLETQSFGKHLAISENTARAKAPSKIKHGKLCLEPSEWLGIPILGAAENRQSSL